MSKRNVAFISPSVFQRGGLAGWVFCLVTLTALLLVPAGSLLHALPAHACEAAGLGDEAERSSLPGHSDPHDPADCLICHLIGQARVAVTAAAPVVPPVPPPTGSACPYSIEQACSETASLLPPPRAPPRG